MTLTPITVRLDLKCGRGSVSKGERCTKGTGSTFRKRAELAGSVGGFFVNVGAAGVGLHALSQGNFKRARQALNVQSTASVVSGIADLSKGMRTKNKKLVQEGKSMLVAGGTGFAFNRLAGGLGTPTRRKPTVPPLGVFRTVKGRAGIAVGNASAAKGRLTQRKQRQSLERSFRNPTLPPPGYKGDSVWADGFQL